MTYTVFAATATTELLLQALFIHVYFYFCGEYIPIAIIIMLFIYMLYIYISQMNGAKHWMVHVAASFCCLTCWSSMMCMYALLRFSSPSVRWRRSAWKARARAPAPRRPFLQMVLRIFWYICRRELVSLCSIYPVAGNTPLSFSSFCIYVSPRRCAMPVGLFCLSSAACCCCLAARPARRLDADERVTVAG